MTRSLLFPWGWLLVPVILGAQRQPGLTPAQIARITQAGEDTAFASMLTKILPNGFDLLPLGRSSCFDDRVLPVAASWAVGDRVRNSDGTEGFVLSLIVSEDNKASLRVFLGSSLRDSSSHHWQDFDYWPPESVAVIARGATRRRVLRMPSRVPQEPCAFLGERLGEWTGRTQLRERECQPRSTRVALCAFQVASGPRYDPQLVIVVASEFRDSIAQVITATYRVTNPLGAMVAASTDDDATDLDELDAATVRYLTLLYGQPQEVTVLTTHVRTWKTGGSIITRDVRGTGEYSDRVIWAWRRARGRGR